MNDGASINIIGLYDKFRNNRIVNQFESVGIFSR
jgi:hypothetical protein